MKGTIKKETVITAAIFIAVAVFAGYVIEMNHFEDRISKLNDQLYNSSAACLEDLNNLLQTQPNFYTSDQQQKKYCEGQSQ